MTARSNDPGTQLRDMDRLAAQIAANAQVFRGAAARMQRVVMGGDETVSLVKELQQAAEALGRASTASTALLESLNEFRQNPDLPTPTPSP